MKRAAFFICILVGCVVFVQVVSAKHLKQALVDAGYSIAAEESGAALRLTYAVALAERSPLIALAGTDPDMLHEEVDRLSIVQKRLAETQKSDRDALYVRALYPITFLHSAAELERTRLNFLSNGSSITYAAYMQQLGDTIAAYESDLAAFTAAFDEVVPDDAPEYATVDAMISKETMLQSLATLKKEIRSVKLKMYLRRACVAGFIFLCDTRDLQTPTIEDASIDTRGEQNTTAEIYDSARDTKEVFRAELARDACTAPFPGEPVYALVELRGSGALRPVYLGDMRLIDAEEKGAIPFYAFFAERGLRYVPSPSFAHYSCARFSNALSRLLALKELSDYAESPGLALMLHNNSAHFDVIVRYVADLESAVMHASEKGAPGDFDVATLFYVRNAFVPLFLANNRSLVANDPLRFAPNNIPRSEQPYTFLSEIAYTPEVIATIIESQRLFDEIHASSQP
jgi:hypothetical protein